MSSTLTIQTDLLVIFGATKAASDSITRALAVKYPRLDGITINSVAVGPYNHRCHAHGQVRCLSEPARPAASPRLKISPASLVGWQVRRANG